jgi:hypothetical protein
MLLLVIGLVALIIAVLVGLFLTRRRRDDDDDEADGRQTVRDRLGSRGRDGRLRTDPRMAHKSAARGPAPTRRPAGEPRGYGGPDRGYEPAGFDQARGYEPSPRGYGERAPRSRDDQRTERIPAARRGGAYQDAPEPATPVGARASRAATAPRRGAVGTDTGPGSALYDTGPSAADLTATRASADPDLADSDVFPRVRAEIPETEAKPRAKSQAKGRGRPSRGRHDDDDDDWPSTEWDKLSDEQYWAELSADKPLATTARSAQPSTAPAATPAKPPRATAPSPASGRAASRPHTAPDAGPEGPGRRQPADRPGRTGVRQGTPRRADGADTDPGRPVPAERPAAAATTERLAARRRPAAEPAPPAYLPAAPVPVPDRDDDDPLTSPHFARGAGGADDSRSYRTPRRNPGPRQDRSGGQAYPSTPNGYPSTPNGYPSTPNGYPSTPNGYPSTPNGYPSAAEAYPASSGGYPATGRNATGPVTNPGGPARGSGPTRSRDSYAGQARDGLVGADNGDRRYTDSSGGYQSYPAMPDGGQGYPTSSGRHGYPAGQADRTDPGASRPDLGASRPDPGSPRTDPGPRTSPGRRRSTAARQAPARQAPASPPPGQAPSPGYPASPAASAPGWGSDRSAAAEAPSAQAGLGNPYGSYVNTAPPAPAPAPTPAPPPAPAARTAPTPASPYQPGQAADGSSYPGYTTGPTAAYSDPYSPGHGSGPGTGPVGYPANGQPPAADGRAEQGTTWYSAPPAAAPQAPAGAYPYQDPGYPAAAGYPDRNGYPATPGTRDDTRHRSGQTEDPYHPDGYSGYHSRQG